MRLCGVLYNSWICAYCQKFMFIQKLLKWRLLELRHFSANLGLMPRPQLPLNNLQDCYETEWVVILLYGDMHVVRNLCLNKNCRNDDHLNLEIFQQNLVWCVVHNSPFRTCRIVMKLIMWCVYCQELVIFCYCVVNKI